MLRQVLSSAMLVGAITAPAAVFAQSSPMPMGSSMAMKMPVCKTGDATVWVNTKSKAFYMSGTPMYGKTKYGKYVCQSDAAAAGDHPAGNGAMGSMKAMSSPMPGGGMSPAPGPVQTGGTTETNSQPNSVSSSSPSP